MGARLWSQRRTARASPQPCHAQTIISPAAFTHSDKLPAAPTTDLGRVTSVRQYPTTIRPSPPNDSCPPNNSLPPNDSSSLPPELSLWPMENTKDGEPVPPHSSAAKKKKKKTKEGRDPYSSPEHLHHQQQHHQQHHLHQPQPFHSHLHYPASGQVLVTLGMDAVSGSPAGLHRMKQDPTLNLPHPVPRLDGEERYPQKRYHLGPEHDETMREFIKAPANKTVIDVGNEATHRPTNLAMLPTPSECGIYSHLHHPPSSSSSSSSQLGYGDEGRSSPRRSRQMSEQYVSQIHPQCRAQFSPNKSYHETSRRGGWQEEGLGMSTPSPSHDPTLLYSTTSSTLAEITSVRCEPAGLSSGVLRDSQTMGSLGVQRGVSQRYGQFSESSCSPTAEHDYPPLHSDVIDDSILDTSVSRPSEPRTKSGEI